MKSEIGPSEIFLSGKKQSSWCLQLQNTAFTKLDSSPTAWKKLPLVQGEDKESR